MPRRRMFSILSGLLPAAATVAAAGGCGPGLEGELLPSGDVTTTSERAGKQAIIGSPINGDSRNILQGVVQISLPGDPQVRTGLLVASDLVLTSSRWVSASMAPAAIQVKHGTGSAPSLSALAVTLNPYLPVAVIQTSGGFAGVIPHPLDGRTAADLVGADVNCYAYFFDSSPMVNEWRFLRAFQEVFRTDGAREYIVGPPGLSSAQLHDWDAGAPCFDSVAGTWVGMAMSTNAVAESRVFVASALAQFIRGMKAVARVRATSSPFKIETVTPGGATMCLDVPWGNPYNHAALNQFPCHGGPNQRWFYDDWCVGDHGTPRLINAITGTCADVPGGSTSAGQAVQMYECHCGYNQRWARWSVSNGEQLRPDSAPALCMSVRGGANGTRIEQASCVANTSHQTWRFVP